MKSLVFSESPQVAAQGVTYLREMGEVDAATLSSGAEALLDYGAGVVYSMEGTALSDNLSTSLNDLYGQGYDYIFIGSTILGREVAGALSLDMDVPIMPEIVSIERADSKMKTKRYFLGGKTLLEEESDAKIFTYAPGIADAQNAGKSEKKTINLPESSVSVLGVENKETSGANIENAKVIVSVGRGIGKKEGIETVQPLVKAVNGELAGSRPICLDYQWLSEDRQVGISGKKVRPKLYIAIGISGQIQHIAGMRGAKTVIAINKDRSAPIFFEADYGIVGDLYQIVPKLVDALRS